MVRDSSTIYAEANDEDTVLSEDLLVNEILLLGANNKNIKDIVDSSQYGAIVFMLSGEIQILPIQPNKKLGTDANGNLAWI